MSRRLRYLPVGSSVVSVFLIACGSGSSATTDNGVSSSPRESSSQQAPHKELHPLNSPKSPGCSSGSASVGSSPSTIRFSVRCWAPPKGRVVRFSLSRSGFARIPHHPSVVGPGAESRYGFCGRRSKQVIDCEARIDGRATIGGELGVTPANRCSQSISITVVQQSACKGPTCPTRASIRELWSGLPRGC